jgi:RNA polymerase sigma factor (TIGR02999 family)
LAPTLPSLFRAIEQGEESAAAALFAALYAELHQISRRELAKRGAPLSLGATTLLHQAYIEMAAREGPSFPDRPRFLGYAARVMRGLIIDHVRSNLAQKRGGLFEITALPNDAAETAVDHRELERVGAALDALARSDPALAEVVDLRFFCGFSFSEVAAVQGTTERTAQRRWEKARIYLYQSVRADLSK